MSNDQQCQSDPSKPCYGWQASDSIKKDLTEIKAALLGGSFEHPSGIVHLVKDHERLLRGDDGKSGLVQACEDIKTVKTVSRAAWITGGILIAVFGSAIGQWIVEHLLPPKK